MIVWKTGHPIADTVADALAEGLNAKVLNVHDDYQKSPANIAYGILRGTAEIFKRSDKENTPWFNADRGYFNPGHYDGYYRISHRGTQARYDASFPAYDSNIPLRPKQNREGYILVCPPTDYVKAFFNIKEWACKGVIREKGCAIPLEQHLHGARIVVTFNSSVGWKALQMGIPCMSDPQHSVVGSYYNANSIDECMELFHSKPRKPLFNFMNAHQFTLKGIAKGEAWPLIRHYLDAECLHRVGLTGNRL